MRLWPIRRVQLRIESRFRGMRAGPAFHPSLVGWVERADRTLVRNAGDTHRRAAELMGFAEGSTDPTGQLVGRVAGEACRLVAIKRRITPLVHARHGHYRNIYEIFLFLVGWRE